MTLEDRSPVPLSRDDVPPVPVFRSGTGARPGVDLSSNHAMLEAIDEGVELDALR
jgi:hypothetical protein